MKQYPSKCVRFSLLLIASVAFGYEAPVFPFAPAAGIAGSTAVSVSDPRIAGWASRVSMVEYGEEVSEEWRVPENALGPAGTDQSRLLVLGRGGRVTLEFSPFIADGPGDDLVVYEHAFGDNFLELAFVEVSSDGEHYVRFPNYSLTAGPVPGFGQVYPTFISGFAGKYRSGFGTPFDLSELQAAHQAALAGSGGFSATFREMLLSNFPYLDLNAIQFVRLVDIPGDGTALDCEGYSIYDPYPTVITAGFDLDGVGVLNQRQPSRLTFSEWSEANSVPAEWRADYDQDGWANPLEYFLGSDPSKGDSKPVFHQSITADGSDLVICFKMNPQAMGEPFLEYSIDGIKWELVAVVPAAEWEGSSLPSDGCNVGFRLLNIQERPLHLFRLTAIESGAVLENQNPNR